MKKIKRLLITLIIFLVVLCISIFNNNYVQTTKKNNIISEYLALDSTTALKNITIKKEIIDAKEYYVAGDDIKYKFTITNNNTESVKINIFDNYNNIGNNQRNLVLKSAKCNDADVSVSGNKIELTDIELSSNGTHICTVDAYAKNTYPEGKVNSRVKVYIDDEEEYIESHFTYLVRDSILDIQVSKFNKYSYYKNEDINYQLKIKNLSNEEASGKIVLEMVPTKNNIRLNESFDENYSYSTSGKTKDIIDNSKIKLKCIAQDGGPCTSTQTQNLTFTIPGLNPGETMTLNITLNNNKDETHEFYVMYNITEYNLKEEVIKKSNYTEELLIKRISDIYISIYPVDNLGNLVTELSDLEFKDGKTQIYLNYDFNRFKEYDGNRTTATPRLFLNLPVNVEYDNLRNYTHSGCSTIEVQPLTLSYGGYEIRTFCGMGNSNDNFIYDANIKVPITINNRLLNREICFDARYDANKYCFGPDLKYLSSSAVQSNNNIVDIKLEFINNAYIGSAKDAKITYTYDNGLEIDESTLINANVDKKTRTITWTIPLIRKSELHTIEFKAKNSSGLTELNIAGKAEENSYEKTISIVQAGKNYLKGDWNLDETVNLLDLSYCRNYLAENGNLALPPAEVYDFDGDNKPTLLDLTGLRKLLVS